MLTFTAIGNSAPLYASLALIGWAYARWRAGDPLPVLPILTIVGLAALSHIALDLPVHADDAHPHFWPFTDWRFYSPVSYYDGDYYGQWAQVIEFLFASCLVVLLWRRFKTSWVRAALAIAILSYIVVPVFWYLQFA